MENIFQISSDKPEGFYVMVGTFSNYENEISLPVYYDLNDENVGLVIQAVKKSVNKFI